MFEPSNPKEFVTHYQALPGAFSGKFKDQIIVISVTIISNDKTNIARGVAVCSPREKVPDVSKGFIIAKNYALRGLKGREDIKPIKNKNAVKIILNTDCPFTNHIEKNPNLTFQEQKFFRLGYFSPNIPKALVKRKLFRLDDLLSTQNKSKDNSNIPITIMCGCLENMKNEN